MFLTQSDSGLLKLQCLWSVVDIDSMNLKFVSCVIYPVGGLSSNVFVIKLRSNIFDV